MCPVVRELVPHDGNCSGPQIAEAVSVMGLHFIVIISRIDNIHIVVGLSYRWFDVQIVPYKTSRIEAKTKEVVSTKWCEKCLRETSSPARSVRGGKGIAISIRGSAIRFLRGNRRARSSLAIMRGKCALEGWNALCPGVKCFLNCAPFIIGRVHFRTEAYAGFVIMNNAEKRSTVNRGR